MESDDRMKHRVTEELSGIFVFVGVIWAVFLINILINFVLPVDINNFGLRPRDMWGAIGVATMPFLHGGWGHLMGNTFPLIILLCLLAGSRVNSFLIVVQIIVLGGVLLWIFGRSGSIHVGASGLIYGLCAFLIVAGFREGRALALAVAVLVAFLYGTTLLQGVLPFTVGNGVSWDGHLTGAIAGATVACAATRTQPASQP